MTWCTILIPSSEPYWVTGFPDFYLQYLLLTAQMHLFLWNDLYPRQLRHPRLSPVHKAACIKWLVKQRYMCQFHCLHLDNSKGLSSSRAPVKFPEVSVATALKSNFSLCPILIPLLPQSCFSQVNCKKIAWIHIFISESPSREPSLRQ